MKESAKDAIAEYFQEISDIDLDLTYDPSNVNEYGGVMLPFVEKLRAQLVRKGYAKIANDLDQYWIWDGIEGISTDTLVQLGYNYAEANVRHGFLGRRDVEFVEYKHYTGPTNGRLFPVRFVRVPNTTAVTTEGVSLEDILKRVVAIVEEAIIDEGNDPGGIDFSPVKN